MAGASVPAITRELKTQYLREVRRNCKAEEMGGREGPKVDPQH